MKDKKLTITEEQINEVINYCIENNTKLLAFVSSKLGWDRIHEDGVLKGAIQTNNVELVHKLYAAGVLQRINKKMYCMLPYGGYIELNKDIHEQLMNMILAAGDGRFASRITTQEVHPYIEKLTDVAVDYLFIERLPGIKLYSAPYALFNLSDEDSQNLSNMVLKGLRQLKAFYEGKIAEGEDIGHPNFETETDANTGMQRLKYGYEIMNFNGQERRVYYRGAYARVEPFDVLSFMKAEDLHELRKLQTDIENMLNYVG